MLEDLNYTIFAECVNTPFQLRLAGHEPLALQLYDVTETTTFPQMEQFSLFFRGPLSPALRQAIYPIEHEKLGAFDLFLVPIGPDGKGMCYESVFNRFRKTGAGA